MIPGATRIVLDVSCVTRINREGHCSWQAQYLVMLEGDSCCSVSCLTKINHEGHFSRQEFQRHEEFSQGSVQ